MRPILHSGAGLGQKTKLKVERIVLSSIRWHNQKWMIALHICFTSLLNGDMSCSQLGFHCVQNDFISGLSFSSYPCVFHWVWWVRSLEDWAVWLSCGHLTESLNGSNWRKTDVWAIKASLAMLGHSPIRLLTVHVKPTVAQSAGLPLEHCRWTAVGSNTMWNTLTPSYPLHLSSRS